MATDDTAAKVAALLLGKVDDLKWFYFDLDFSQFSSAEADSPVDQSFLDKIIRVDEHYEWKGGDHKPSTTHIFRAVAQVLETRPYLSKDLYRRIFDLEQLPNKSGSDKGLIGLMNRFDQARRERLFHNQVWSERCQSERCVIVAEGDSWFQYPSFGFWRLRFDAVTDVIDHLCRNRNVYMRSLASGGDWLSNMLHSREYIPELSSLEPHVFLFSGGGNDILGSGRVANMVKHLRRIGEMDSWTNDLVDVRTSDRPPTALDFDPETYSAGLRLLDKEFFTFMNLISVQYFLFFLGLTRTHKLSQMKIITQGYDYAIPRKSRGRWWELRYWINHVVGSGKWLWEPMEAKALNNEQKRQAVYAMITELNELLVGFAASGIFKNLYHVDNRGTARSVDDWFDEIHLTSRAFSRVAARIQTCIDEGSPTGPKVFRIAGPA